MSGGGAGAVASTAGANWQFDIPALSQLILSAGSYGLKQLANDGVDLHTLGCMLMIAEYTPASEEFKRSFTRQREIQENLLLKKKSFDAALRNSSTSTPSLTPVEYSDRRIGTSPRS